LYGKIEKVIKAGRQIKGQMMYQKCNESRRYLRKSVSTVNLLLSFLLAPQLILIWCDLVQKWSFMIFSDDTEDGGSDSLAKAKFKSKLGEKVGQENVERRQFAFFGSSILLRRSRSLQGICGRKDEASQEIATLSRSGPGSWKGKEIVGQIYMDLIQFPRLAKRCTSVRRSCPLQIGVCRQEFESSCKSKPKPLNDHQIVCKKPKLEITEKGVRLC